MIDNEGKYRGVNWWEYDEGALRFCAITDGKKIKASTLPELKSFIDQSISDSREKVLRVMKSDEKQISNTNIPAYREILERYDPREAERLRTKQKPKLLTSENRAAILEITAQGTSLYAEKAELPPKEGKPVYIKKNIGNNRTFKMSAEVIKLPDSRLREDINFQIDEDSNFIGIFTLSRVGTLENNEWNLFHRQVYKDEYKGASKYECGVSRVAMDALNIFLQDRANRLDDEVSCTLVSSQPQVIIWALKEGFQLEDSEQEKKWKQMQRGTGLVMKGEGHIYPNTIPPGFGWDKFDYAERGFRIKLKKIFLPQKKID